MGVRLRSSGSLGDPLLIEPTYEKSGKEKSCSLPIIYLLLLFLSSICIKYLNWEIPNVHNLQQASNPGNLKISYGSSKTCHFRVEHNTRVCYGKYYHIKERQHQRRSKASCRSTRNGNVIENLIPMAWAIQIWKNVSYFPRYSETKFFTASRSLSVSSL